MTATIIAACNRKGGVGKTTTVYHLTRAAIARGLRVLVVDADPQGNVTGLLGADIDEEQAGLADVLSKSTPDTVRDVAVPGIWPGLDIVPTTGEGLGVVAIELTVTPVARETRLRAALELVREDYDVIFIDCGPNLDQLVINALTAADRALVVTQTKLLSAQGLVKLLQAIDEVAQHYNPALKIAGILANQHEGRTLEGAHWLEAITTEAQARGLHVLTPPMPKRQVISDVTEASEGLDEGDSDARELAAHYDGYIQQLMEGN